MTPAYDFNGVTIYQGDVLDCLRRLPAESVQCVITSPPYYGLRDYGIDGQIGLEETSQAHICTLVEVFREVRRVLRKDGTLWLNYGDCYASSVNGRSAADTKAAGNDDRTFRDKPFSTVGNGMKPKDLMLMPSRIAIALQDDGWWVRSEITWCKRAPMPESVTDRPTNATEKVYLLTKAERYYYDADAVREPHTEPERGKGQVESRNPHHGRLDDEDKQQAAFTVAVRQYNPLGRNLWNYVALPQPMYRLRADLTPEQREYVLKRICGVDCHSVDDIR